MESIKSQFKQKSKIYEFEDRCCNYPVSGGKEKEQQSEEVKKVYMGSPCRGAVEMNPTRNHEVAGLIPDFAQWVEDPALPRAVVWVTDKAQM